MKVAIITWHYMDNYGGVLQCWALQKALQDLSMEVDILNYQPPLLQSKLTWWRGWRLTGGGFFKNFPSRLLRLLLGKPAERKFDAFRESHLNLTLPCYLLQEVRKTVVQYDAVVVGSDQVWRFPQEKVYFMDFGSNFKGIKISYAACCGSADDGRYSAVVDLWKGMDAIAVRNGFSKEIIDHATGGDVPVVVDPTLLVDVDQLEMPIDGIPEKYIVTYIMGAAIEGGHRTVLDAIKQKIGNLPVIAIVATAQCPQFFSFADRRLYHVGPEEWVGLLKHASFIYTDSFHATLYALKHQRRFLAYYAEPSRSGRFIDLIERYALSNRIATSADDAVAKLAVAPAGEEEQTNNLIVEHIAESYEFIRTTLAMNSTANKFGRKQA